MDLLRTFHRTLPLPALGASEHARLAAWKAELDRLGYCEEAVARALKVSDLHFFWPEEVYGLRRSCLRDGSPVARLTAFWLLNAALSDPGGPLDLLESLRLIGPGHRAQASLFPCLGLTVLTDPMFAERPFQHSVYRLGNDSYALARLTPRTPVGRSLDLCTGSGVQALLNARHSREALAVDINPRALQFAQLNAALNSLSLQTRQGDLFEAVDGRFDLITCNPPFVPTPEKVSELFRSGGESGEELVERMVRALPERLNPGGTFAMVTHYPVLPETSFLDRMRHWLGPGDWGVGLLNLVRYSPERYAVRNLRPDLPREAQFESWLASYERLGISEVVEAVVLVRQGADFSAERDLSEPREPLGEAVEAWLQALAARGPSRGRHPMLERLLIDERGGGVALHRLRAWAPAGVELSAEEVACLQGGEGTPETVARLAHNLLILR